MSAVLFDTPVVTPAVSPQSFETIWLRRLAVDATVPSRVVVQAEIVPSHIDPSTGAITLYNEGLIPVVIDDFFNNSSPAEQAIVFEIIAMLKARAGV